ncbi:heavy metal-binding domain-containing protein [Lewinella sp. W8]|uniref:heavy metal-binding domain-containing protein n=1 Tax=Lewinella sp. W8 TaxID=2528208 RepID=UPI001067D9BD|nr:heavy metal-binding domain-containing protein [Lewinella sp. W8]MTB50025.1 hypothetical protein [Lewinella sp. W8]
MRFTHYFIACLFLLSFAIVSCSDAPAAETDTTETTTETTTAAPHGKGKEYTSAYVCPMHCEGSGSDTAGECPVCGMAYVDQEEHVKNGHSH